MVLPPGLSPRYTHLHTVQPPSHVTTRQKGTNPARPGDKTLGLAQGRTMHLTQSCTRPINAYTWGSTHARTHAHKHTHPGQQEHTCTHTEAGHAHIYTPGGAHTHIHTYTWGSMHTHTPHTLRAKSTCTHLGGACVHMRAHTHVGGPTCTCTHTHLGECTHVPRGYVSAHMCAHTHKYTYPEQHTHLGGTCLHMRTHMDTKEEHPHTHPEQQKHAHPHVCTHTHGGQSMNTHTHPGSAAGLTHCGFLNPGETITPGRYVQQINEIY